ncbi:MAG: hypothetical protein KDI90_05450 [Alphaproteobacteria bacterium]|nr:hypothetical protein [Alphaproteobacteria bacterium]MCB9974259.1 hypothetical protein [Rhodospirillales bacterium]
MAEGAVISDLHLFARRTDTERITKTLLALPEDIGTLVLNGDILDFRWSLYHSETDTIAAGVGWIEELMIERPGLSLCYIMGNHDCSVAWGEALEGLRSERFSWSPTHIRLGSNLFLHGDLIGRGKNPFYRALKDTHKRFATIAALDHAYDMLTHMRVHTGASLLHGPKLSAPRIEKALRRHEPDIFEGLEDIYFGHTHTAYSDHTYKGVRFHNTGAAIRHVPLQALRFKHE